MSAAAPATTAIPTHVTAVARTERLGERFVRVTFAGGLDRFRPVGPDQFVYLLVPPPGRVALTIGADFSWSQFEELAEAERPVGAYYTVRHHRPGAGELDCDVFLHDPAGHGSRWAAAAVRGAPAALWGPRTAWAPPPGTTRWLLVADETGVPALEAVLDELPADADVVAVVGAARPDEVAPIMDDRRRVAIVSGDLLDAVRSLDLDRTGLYAWGGAESRAMLGVRRYLRQDVGLAKEQVSMTPYWRREPST